MHQVVGWGEDVEELATGLAEFAVDGTLVTVISSERPQGLPESLRGCRFRHVHGSPTSFSSFHQAGLADCDSLLLGAPSFILPSVILPLPALPIPPLQSPCLAFAVALWGGKPLRNADYSELHPGISCNSNT